MNNESAECGGEAQHEIGSLGQAALALQSIRHSAEPALSETELERIGEVEDFLASYTDDLEEWKEIQREDIRLQIRGDQPTLEIGDAEIILQTHFEGAPPEGVEIDYHGDGAYYVMDFDEEYFGGLLEIAPEFIPAAGDSSE